MSLTHDGPYITNSIYGVQGLHLEFTSYCNARCPQCARTKNKSLPLRHLPAELIFRRFSPQFCRQLKEMYSCGNYGDPVMHPQCREICLYFLRYETAQVALHTNGSVQNPDWWFELGQHLTKNRGWVYFSVDGLEDTNSIYRVGTDWQKIIANMQAFIKGGGNARWNYLVFSHNEHQVEQAKALALKMGFEKFITKVTLRDLDKFGESTRDKNKPESSTQELFQSRQKKKILELQGNKSAFNKIYAHDEILCQTKNERSIYVSFQGKVYPCCWMGSVDFLRSQHYKNDLNAFFRSQNYASDFNSLEKHDLESVINHEFFERHLSGTWKSGKRLKICAEKCTKTLHRFHGQKIKRESLREAEHA